MRKFLVFSLLLTVILAACGGDDEKDQPQDNVTPSPTADAEAPRPVEGDTGQITEPGIRVDGGLEVVGYNSYVNENGIGWVVMELRNGNVGPIPNAQVNVSFLDNENRARGAANLITPMVNIPPGYSIPLVREFIAPANYTDFFGLATVDTFVGGNINQFVGEYDLPNTLNPIQNPSLPLKVTGTMTNDRGADLVIPIATVLLYDSTGKLLGVGDSVITGTDATGLWAAGVTVNFEVTFSYLPSLDIANTKVVTAGYRLTTGESPN